MRIYTGNKLKLMAVTLLALMISFIIFASINSHNVLLIVNQENNAIVNHEKFLLDIDSKILDGDLIPLENFTSSFNVTSDQNALSYLGVQMFVYHIEVFINLTAGGPLGLEYRFQDFIATKTMDGIGTYSFNLQILSLKLKIYQEALFASGTISVNVLSKTENTYNQMLNPTADIINTYTIVRNAINLFDFFLFLLLFILGLISVVIYFRWQKNVSKHGAKKLNFNSGENQLTQSPHQDILHAIEDLVQELDDNHSKE